MSLLKLIQSVLPNFGNAQLRGMVPWFVAVSQFVDDFFTTEPTFKAGALVASNAYSQQYGFTAPVTHVGAGIYECFFATALDATTNYLAMVSLANLGVADAVLYDIGVQIVDTGRIRVRIYSLADTGGATTPTAADHDFFVRVERLPGV